MLIGISDMSAYGLVGPLPLGPHEGPDGQYVQTTPAINYVSLESFYANFNIFYF